MVWFAVAAIVIVVVLSAVAAHNAIGRRGKEWADDPHWVGGIFFHDRSDKRLFVPKRFGFGWTPNFAHPASWLVVVLPLLIALLASLRS